MNLKDIFEKSVFLLGAGGTTEAGCRTSKDMLIDLVQQIDSNEEDRARDLKYEAFCFIRACLEYQSTWKNIKRREEDFGANIEEFAFVLRKIINRDHYLPYPLVGNWSEKILQLENKNENIFKELLNDIESKYLISWLRFEDKKRDDLLKPIKNFFQKTSRESFKIDAFTLNYDLTFESYFNVNDEVILNDGFLSGRWCDSFDSADQEEAKYRINYYKLHGSLNWEKNEESGDVIRSNDYVPVSSPLIIFGQEEKMLSVDPFLSLISRFKKKLEKSDYFFIIGYSFYDTYINNLLLEELYKQPQKKLVILKRNISEGDIEKIKIQISDKISRIQSSEFQSSYYNVKRISADKIVVIPLSAGGFYNDFFKSKGSRFTKFIQEISDQDEPFK